MGGIVPTSASVDMEAVKAYEKCSEVHLERNRKQVCEEL